MQKEVKPTRWEGPSREEIARQAYFLWERNGRPEQRDLEFWSMAESELLARRAGQEGGSPPGNDAANAGTSTETASLGSTTSRRAAPGRENMPLDKDMPRGAGAGTRQKKPGSKNAARP